jgi:predicted nuclease with TOPRIM domain
MSNELTLVLAVASAAGLVGGALVAWRTRHGATAPDPADEGRREVALIELQDAVSSCRREYEATRAKLQEQCEETGRALAHVATLEAQVAAYLRQYAQAKNTLKAEIRQKNSLRTELAAATAQVQALQGRIQELEMERTSASGTNRRISIA